MDDILLNKEEIMKNVREDVITYFADKGITITALGMKDGIEYDDVEIQKTINEKFSSAQKLVTQRNENAVTKSKAEAEAEAETISANAEAQAIIIKAEAEAEANRMKSQSLTKEIIESQKIEAWKSGGAQVPKIASDVIPFITMNEDVLEEEQ